jgi:DNA mismatch repair protein MutS
MNTEYEQFWNQYRPKYGPNTAILLMVGKFYELYDIQDPETGQTSFNVRDICDFLGLQLTVRRGDAPGGKDVLFAGIPEQVLHKWAGRLTDNGWTVVVIDQVKDRTGKVVRREVARILSPGTHWEHAASHETPSIVGIWMSAGPTFGAPPTFGAAAFDLSTGITSTLSGEACGRTDVWSSDDLTHYLQVQAPRELIFWWAGDALDRPDEPTLRRRLAYPAGALHIRQAGPSALDVALARENFLREVYNIQSLLPVREWLHVREDTIAELALCHLLLFVKEHLPSAFERLHQNQRWSPPAAMRLGNNALTQLQIIAPRLQDSVLGLFGSCITPMGKRGIRARLLQPTADADILQRRYDQLGAFMGAAENQRKNIQKLLRAMFDLPRLHRRMICSQTTAADIGCLHQSYLAAELLALAVPAALQPPPTLLTALSEWRQGVFEREFSVEKAQQATASPDITFLQASAEKNADIFRLEGQLAGVRGEATKFCATAKAMAGVGSDAIRLEERDTVPYGLRGTTTALKSFKAATAPGGAASLIDAFKDVSVKSQTSGGWIETPWLEALNAKTLRLREALASALKVCLPDICRTVSEVAESSSLWRMLEDWVEGVDIVQCLARVSEERAYVRPTLQAGESAAVSAKNLRHPLIESILTRTEYVKHNVELGSETFGWLVYGMNASGKSSLMKSIGIAVHLAQCGCYVPASEFVITPFKSIYTRILNQDNLWAGLSSFAVEMSEMREILAAADEHTLVLGDELCSGTESTGAQALVAAGIEWLSERRARYVFATHLHGLTDILPAPESLRLQVWHLRVVYDAARDRLIYDRSLRPGSGSSQYGLEVARAMHLPTEFLTKAHAYRRKLLGSVNEAEATGSAWNSAVQRRACEMCGAGIIRDLEVHHIRPRVEAAGAAHFTDGAGRDDARNLIVVCQRCHDEHHAGRLDIQPLRMTSDGPVRVPVPATVTAASLTPAPAQESVKTLDFSQFKYAGSIGSSVLSDATQPTHTKSKWTAAEQETIMDVLRKNPGVSLKLLVFKLQASHGIEISEGVLRKVRTSGGF